MQDEQDRKTEEHTIRVHKLGSDKEPATEQDIERLKDEIRRDTVRCPTDTQLLDWLQKQTKGYGIGWIVRNSCCGRGMRLHETSQEGAMLTIRKAIIKAMGDDVYECYNSTDKIVDDIAEPPRTVDTGSEVDV